MPHVTLRQMLAVVASAASASASASVSASAAAAGAAAFPRPSARLLGLDVGTTYIGVAVSDALCHVAFPHSVVLRHHTRRSNSYNNNFSSESSDSSGTGGSRTSTTATAVYTVPSDDVSNDVISEGVRRLRRIVEETGAVGLVVGFPLELHGGQSRMTISTRDFLRHELGSCPELAALPHLLWDERYSSVAAAGVVSGLRLGKAELKRISDKVSATIILQGCLDAMAQLRRQQQQEQQQQEHEWKGWRLRQ